MALLQHLLPYVLRYFYNEILNFFESVILFFSILIVVYLLVVLSYLQNSVFNCYLYNYAKFSAYKYYNACN